MLAVNNILEILSLDNRSVKDSNDFSSMVIAHVQAEPRVVPRIMPKLVEQASLSGKGAELEAAVCALNAFEALANNCILLTESYLCANLITVLNAASNKQTRIREASEAAAMAITSRMSPNAVRGILPCLFNAAAVGSPWQTRALALKIIASFGDHAPEQLGNALPEVIPQVTISMSEPKKEVSQAAFDAITNACNVIGNRDIEHMTPKIVRSISNPEEVPEIMHNLAGVTFVQSVESPALAMVVPLLIRGSIKNYRNSSSIGSYH